MKKIINTPKVAKPIGPYSQGVVVGNMLFTSGQIALDAVTGNLVMEDVRTETHKVMSNLKELLAAADTDFGNTVKTSIFLKSLDDFPTVNEVYASYFSNTNFPARDTVQVAKLPLDVNVEISMIVEIL